MISEGRRSEECDRHVATTLTCIKGLRGFFQHYGAAPYPPPWLCMQYTGWLINRLQHCQLLPADYDPLSLMKGDDDDGAVWRMGLPPQQWVVAWVHASWRTVAQPSQPACRYSCLRYSSTVETAAQAGQQWRLSCWLSRVGSRCSLLLICCGGFAARQAGSASGSLHHLYLICTATDWCDQTRLTGSHLCVSSTGGQEWRPPAVLSMD
jgi:hypothetical protein